MLKIGEYQKFPTIIIHTEAAFQRELNPLPQLFNFDDYYFHIILLWTFSSKLKAAGEGLATAMCMSITFLVIEGEVMSDLTFF